MMQEYRVMDFIQAVLSTLKEKGIKSNHMTLEKCNDDLNRDTDNWKATLTVKDGTKIKKFTEKFNSYEVNSDNLSELFIKQLQQSESEIKGNNYHIGLKFAQKVIELLTEKGVNIIDTSVYRYEPRRKIDEWVLKVRTEKKTGVRVIFDLKMNVQMVANRIYNMIIEEENNMCYSSLFNDGRSHAQLIVNKANGEANRILIQEGLISNNESEEGIFINALDYNEVLDEWVVDIVHKYEGANKHFRYPITENVEDLTNRMVIGWKQDKGLI